MNHEHNDSESEHQRLPRRPRQLSHFLAQEMLYDYLKDRLDPDRRNAMEVLLSNNEELKNDLENMREAEKYLARLGQTKISNKTIERLRAFRPIQKEVMDRMRWQNWPDFARWSTEAFGVSIIVALLALVLPWQKIDLTWLQKETQVTLAKIEESKPVILPDQTKKVEIKEPEVPATAPAASATPTQQTLVAKAVDEDVRAKVETNKNKVITMKGLLYRMIMTSENANNVSANVVEKLKQLGAEKAGQVELGWRKKNPDGNYFHFSMPETSYNELVKTLGEYGPVRIYKNPHERVMPEGQIRIILWIEERAPAAEPAAPTQPPQENETTEQAP